MFEAKISKAKLGEVLDVADALVEEAVLQFDADGLTVTVVDPANVGMARVDVPESDFDVYETNGVRLGVFIGKFSDVLGMMGADDVLEMHLDEETRKLELSAGGLNFTMALIDPDSINTMDELPDLPFGAKATVETTAVKRAVKAADMVSDHLTLRVEDGAFSIEASGDTDDIDYAATDAKVAPGSDGDIEDAKSMFSLSYLKDMFKAINGDYVSASIAEDMPVRIEFKLAQSDGTGVFFVSPRISGN
jgi:proliferating cell nuclear antigen